MPVRAMDSKEIVERATILRATVGSTVHGLHPGGQDDRDEMAVFVEPPEFLLGRRGAAGAAARAALAPGWATSATSGARRSGSSTSGDERG
jgi:hypothetical protein